MIDECHRGSAAEDSAWREILEYFTTATQVGLTATPKETKYVSNIHYFGEPVYTYSLKQGIADGFLAPYKVIKVPLDIDVEDYRPEKGTLDKYNQPIVDRVYNQKDFDRTLVIDERTKLVAQSITEFLKESGRPLPENDRLLCRSGTRGPNAAGAYQRECRPRAAKSPLRHAHHRRGYRGTGGAGQLPRPVVTHPVLVTTSRLLSTGVDAQTCRLIVIDREVGSLTEFKQIVGRARASTRRRRNTSSPSWTFARRRISSPIRSSMDRLNTSTSRMKMTRSRRRTNRTSRPAGRRRGDCRRSHAAQRRG